VEDTESWRALAVPEKTEGELVVIWESDGRETMEFVFWRGAGGSYEEIVFCAGACVLD
jgi:hypothetical protein